MQVVAKNNGRGMIGIGRRLDWLPSPIHLAKVRNLQSKGGNPHHITMAFSNDSHSVATQSTASTKVNEIYRRSKARTPEEELARRIVPKLAARSYHLPGYNLRQDWLQYMLNNHP